MKRLLQLGLFLALAGATCLAANPTWSFKQSNLNYSCSGSSASCTVTLGSGTTANSVLVMAALDVESTHISSASGGGGSWTLCPSSGCLNSTAYGDAGGMDLIYNLTNTGGASSFTLTLSAAPGHAWDAWIGEWACTANCGTTTLDVYGKFAGAASCSTCTAAAMTGNTGGSKDVLIQAIAMDNNPVTPSSGWALDPQAVFCYALNSGSTTAPTICQSSSTSSCVADAGAFEATAIAFTNSGTGNSYTATPSETNTASDSVGRVLGANRTDSETNTASDTSLARHATLARGDSESNTASDSLSAMRNSHPWTATISETLTFSDSSGRVATLYRTDSETNIASDTSLGRVLAASRGDMETNTASDSVGRTAGFARSDSETNTAYDVAVAALHNFTWSLPIKASSSGRYLTDQNGTPWFMVGDAAWFPMNLLTPVQMSTYFSTRQSQGFNAILVVVGSDPSDSESSTGALADGTLPFTTGSTFANYDVSTPNPAYFAEVDEMINLAASYGLTVLLNALDNYTTMYAFEASGTTKTNGYGSFLGNRYKNFKNIIWVQGNDFQDWSTSSTDNGLAAQLMSGILSADPNHLQSIELNYNMAGSCDDSTLLPYETMGFAYTMYPVYWEVQHEWSTCSPTMPVFLGESYYEGGYYGNLTPTVATDQMLRSEAWETSLSGGLAGYVHGSNNVWPFGSGWQSALSTLATTQVGYWASFLESIPWQNFVYDSSHTWVTAGYGTASGDGTGNIATDTYVPVSYTSDSKRLVAYDAQGATLTVALSQFAQSIRARWYDPSAGTYAAISGSPFSNSGSHSFSTPGNNSEGNTDWVLVLDPSGNVYSAGISETNTAVDYSLTRLVAYSRADSETNTASDTSLARQAGFARGPSETNTASASLTGSHGMYPAITETHTAADSLGRAAGFNRTDSETNTASDALARLGNFGRGDSETNTATDLLSALKPTGNVHNAVMNEALSLSDALSRLSAYLRGSSETNTASDALGRLAVCYRQAAETATFSDVMAGIWTRSLGIPVQPRHAGTVPGKTKTGEAPVH